MRARTRIVKRLAHATRKRTESVHQQWASAKQPAMQTASLADWPTALRQEHIRRRCAISCTAYTSPASKPAGCALPETHARTHQMNERCWEPKKQQLPARLCPVSPCASLARVYAYMCVSVRMVLRRLRYKWARVNVRLCVRAFYRCVCARKQFLQASALTFRSYGQRTFGTH